MYRNLLLSTLNNFQMKSDLSWPIHSRRVLKVRTFSESSVTHSLHSDFLVKKNVSSLLSLLLVVCFCLMIKLCNVCSRLWYQMIAIIMSQLSLLLFPVSTVLCASLCSWPMPSSPYSLPFYPSSKELLYSQ